jgi:isoleucyl-tRNA synthetase
MVASRPFADVESKPSFPSMEEEVLKFWKKEEIFQQSVSSRDPANSYIFYDGPPFATGLPHYGHLLQGAVKDLFPRYMTMRGLRVERRFGWDCHGLPIEMETEAALGVSGRPEIEAYGVDRYNEECRAGVLRYTHEWQVVTERMGRWIDFENDYKTMDRDFMESVWWVFKELFDKGLIYEGFKVLPYSWKVSTPLSNFEANLNYMDTQDPSLTVACQLKGEFSGRLLVWTTTPWTLPANLALCVGPDLDYVKLLWSKDQEIYYIGKKQLGAYFEEGSYEVLETLQGKDLQGFEYESLLAFAKDRIDSSKTFRVLLDDYVSDESGTGIVHQAPAFGEDDLRICQREGIEVFDPIDDQGNFLPDMGFLAGLNFKEADKTIIRELKQGGLVFRHETLDHSYPFCWRTDTPLMYKAISTWFVNVESLKDRMVAHNKTVHWVPGHIRDGRFGKWLENARDWAISRNRFWGTPLPVWKSEDGDLLCFGSVQELEEASGQSFKDIHKHFVDSIEIHKDGKIYHRVSEVLDCWFESGSMPYAQQHYPFKNRDEFESRFPADFICEALDQTRGWFYTLSVIATALFDKPAFKNVICTGLILSPDGRKLSKRHKNYTDPMEIFDRYGADALRYFLVTSPVVKGQEVRFCDNEVKEVVKSTILPLWNIFSFLVSYANIDGIRPIGKTDSKNVLDRYILSEFSIMLQVVTRSLDSYELNDACRSIERFLETLSNWYLRRSRRRFWKEESDDDKLQAYETLYFVLKGFTKVLAPFMPFLSDQIYRHLTEESSVHLSSWDRVDSSLIDEQLSQDMDAVRIIVSLGHSLRSKNRRKVRKPVGCVKVGGSLSRDLVETHKDVLMEELNAKDIIYESDPSKLGSPYLVLNSKVLGPKFGKNFQTVLRAAKQGDFELQDDKAYVGGFEIDGSDFEMGFRAQEGFDCASEGQIIVSLDLTETEELVFEGHAREIIRHVQNLRKDAGYRLSDRIQTRIITDSEPLRQAITHFDKMISTETLCVDLRCSATLEGVERESQVSFDGFSLKIQIKRS